MQHKAFKELIVKYRSVKIEEISGVYDLVAKELPTTSSGSIGFDVMNLITGFGANSSCTLCQEAKSICNNCSWFALTKGSCLFGENWDTYITIKEAKTPEAIHAAINARADYMEKVLNEKENGND